MNQQNQEIQQQQIHKRQLLWTPQIIDFQFTIAHGVVLAGLREDFCLLLKGISSGTFPVNNIALRLLLDIAQFGSAVSEGKI